MVADRLRGGGMVADIWMIGIILRGRGVLVYDGQTDRQMDICYSKAKMA